MVTKSEKKVYIIGEIGVNHNGDIDIARKLIKEAKEAGVDAVKFQSFNPEKTKIKTTPYANYQEQNSKFKSSFEMSMKLKLSYEDHVELKRYCDEVGLDFLSTGFDNDSVDTLESLNVKYQKIPSGEINNFPLIKYIAMKQKPIILSTGMADLSEIDECVRYIKKFNNQELVILHCVSLYPTSFDKVNLNFIKTLQNTFDATIGFSDHTLGIEADIAAVALGAKMIEKHITLDKSMEGPDHKVSLNPEELRHMVSAIRNIEKALGTKYKIVCDEEIEMRKISRRSIVISEDIEKGNKFTEENLAIKKPGTGLSSKYLEVILGRTVTRNLLKDEILTWDMVGELE
ncbi:N-acetylneuraminate synthase [Clostridium sp. D2Q-14]|uniref:N-acetylneuraminate synthase n=1 Tax=Anaeromonas gelatinilytica TaxID=2683194 RepID=UPI00193BEA36|nr:N-acetylneuraminate synthase [Anaeromonas gelatinilytica]MBS4534372.1 N-acetylneuraminate synthase [Anaeromonas gelatinilytica]